MWRVSYLPQRALRTQRGDVLRVYMREVLFELLLLLFRDLNSNMIVIKNLEWQKRFYL